YVYDEGSFHRGTRNIPLDKVESITGVRVEEDRAGQLVDYRESGYDPDESTSGVPGTFGTRNDGSQLWVRWVYDYASNTSKTFHLLYHAAGAVRVYDTYDQLNWNAVPPHWASPIYSSRVSVTLPAGADVTRLEVASYPPVEATKQANTVTWSASSGLDQGFRVGIRNIPKSVLLGATAPSWQAGVDTWERTQPLLNIAALLLGLLALVGGVLWSIMRW